MSTWRTTGRAAWDENGNAEYGVTNGNQEVCASDLEELDALLAGWISVDEALPEPKAKKVSAPVFFINSAGHWAGFYMIDDKAFVSSDSWDQVHGVTHFMPRPKLPTN